MPHPKGKIGVLICFETIFPELSRAFKQDGCRILVNMTNDAWFGDDLSSLSTPVHAYFPGH